MFKRTSRILVLKRSYDSSDDTIKILEKAGFISTITSIITVIYDIAAYNPDLSIFDQLLKSSLTETSICQKIRLQAELTYLPIIAVSNDNQRERFAKVCNANAYIVQPYDSSDFFKTAKDVLLK